MGAWIETIIAANFPSSVEVAPRVGAWIETRYGIVVDETIPVAPRVGAWIETGAMVWLSGVRSSRPAWARGLKLFRFHQSSCGY